MCLISLRHFKAHSYQTSQYSSINVLYVEPHGSIQYFIIKHIDFYSVIHSSPFVIGKKKNKSKELNEVQESCGNNIIISFKYTWAY